MKIKILVMPLVIAVTIVFSIWFVYPVYSNKKDGGIKNDKEKLIEGKKKLSDMMAKGANVEKLYSEINTISSEKKILYDFIPEESKEDEIIGMVNRFASESGLILNGVNIKSSSTTTAKTGDSSVGNKLNTASVPSSKEVLVSVGMSGSYEKIKVFLEKIYKSGRYGKLKSLQLDRSASTAGENVDFSMLSATAEIDFGVLSRIKVTDGNMNDTVFSGNSLDMSVVDLIKNQKTMTDLTVRVDQRGKSNLFMP